MNTLADLIEEIETNFGNHIAHLLIHRPNQVRFLHNTRLEDLEALHDSQYESLKELLKKIEDAENLER